MLYVNPMATSLGNTLAHTKNPARRQQLALQELEHYFLYTLFKEMRKTLQGDTVLGNKTEQGPVRDMLDDALSREIAQSGKFGLARQMQQALRQEQLSRDIARSHRVKFSA